MSNFNPISYLNEETPIVQAFTKHKAVPTTERPIVYTTDELADILRSTVPEVQKLLRDGLIFGFKIGQTWRIPHQAVIDFMFRGGEYETE